DDHLSPTPEQSSEANENTKPQNVSNGKVSPVSSEAKKKKKRSAAQDGKGNHSEASSTKRSRKAKLTIAPDSELAYTNGAVVDAYKGFSAKYDEPVILVSYKEPLPSGFEKKQDEIVPIRLIARSDPQNRLCMMNWSSDYSALPNSLDIRWSDSREVVEVPGGAEWKIRRLQEELPEFCWKYCGTSSIAQYYFDMASREASMSKYEAGDSASLPVFYAIVPHFVSPFELSIQPRFLEKPRRNLVKQMAAEYCHTDIPGFSEDQ
ncbi:hypothetical protein GCK32_009406, partial [Trichostrongylus colubriformis]